MEALILSILVLAVTFLISGYVIWLQFRAEEYDEQKVIDVLVGTAVIVLIFSRLMWIGLHWAEFEFSVKNIFFVTSLNQMSTFGALIGFVVASILFSYKNHWPYVKTITKLCWGGVVMTIGFAIIMVLRGVHIELLYWIPYVPTYTVDAVWYLLYITLLSIIVWAVNKKIPLQQYGIPIFLVLVPQVPSILLAIFAGIIMWYHTSYGKPPADKTTT